MSTIIKNGIVKEGRLLIEAVDLPGLEEGRQVRVRVEVLGGKDEPESDAGDAIRRIAGRWKGAKWPDLPEEMLGSA